MIKLFEKIIVLTKIDGSNSKALIRSKLQNLSIEDLQNLQKDIEREICLKESIQRGRLKSEED